MIEINYKQELYPNKDWMLCSWTIEDKRQALFSSIQYDKSRFHSILTGFRAMDKTLMMIYED